MKSIFWKKRLLSLAYLILVFSPAEYLMAQEERAIFKNRDGAIRKSAELGVSRAKKFFPSLKNSTHNINYQDLRPLDEINDPSRADAYPWISPDALRLYFTRQTSEGDRIVFSERESQDSFFGEVEILNINRPGVDNFSCWLNQDETEIYFTARNPENLDNTELFRATRTHRDEPFAVAQKVQLEGEFSGFFSGPSLNQDQSQLFLYNVTQILEFERKSEQRYKLKSAIHFADSLGSNPGQLSKDDLRYFTSLDISSQEEEFMLFLERSGEQSEFISTGRIVGEVENGPFPFNFQPSTSQNDEVIVFVSNASNFWRDNNLYIAQRSTNREFTLEAFLIDTAQDSTLFPLNSGSLIDMDALGLREFSLEIKTGDNKPDSVRIELEGPVSFSRLEKLPPYTLFGDDLQGNYFPFEFCQSGDYSLRTYAYKKGLMNDSLLIEFSLLRRFEIREVFWVDAEQDKDIRPVQENDIFDLASQKGNISLRVASPICTESIAFYLINEPGDTLIKRVENLNPYVIEGDNTNGDIYPWLVQAGKYQLVLIPYAENKQKGQAGETLIRNFEIINSQSPGNQARVFPHPLTSGTFELQLPFINDLDLVIKIYSLEGSLLWQNKIPNKNKQASVLLSLPPSLPRGKYVMQLQGSTYQERLLILKRD